MSILCRCNIVFCDISKDFNSECAKIIEQHNIKDVHGNYLDAYPIVAAVLLDEVTQILNGSTSFRANSFMKQLAHKYMSRKLDV